MTTLQIINTFLQSVNFSADDEVKLFRALARAIETHTKSVFIDETHGAIKCNVEFQSLANKLERCEIADLLIISCDDVGHKFRATFWQAKKEAASKWEGLTANAPLLDFKAQYNQWELLARRPDVVGVAPFHPPTFLLSGASSASIGSFGTFYVPGNNYGPGGPIEVFHCDAEWISCANPGPTHSRFVAHRKFQHWLHRHQGRVACPTLADFLDDLLNGQIGEPVDPTTPLGQWIISYAKGKGGPQDFFNFNGGVVTHTPLDTFGPDDGLSVLFVDPRPRRT
jgi:hypothetical protein